MPRFDEPCLTIPGGAACAAAGLTIAEQEPLPALADPEPLRVTSPDDSPLVRLIHPRIVVLANYAQAGWTNACPDSWLRAEVHNRLCAAAESLPDRFGLSVFDAWRPLDLQTELFHAAYDHADLPPGFIAPPSTDPEMPPPHLTGGSVDCSLTLDGAPLAPGAGFDDTTPLAWVAALEDTPGTDRELRRLLYWTMQRQGFVVYHGEWWHYEYGTARWGAITGAAPRFGPTEPPNR